LPPFRMQCSEAGLGSNTFNDGALELHPMSNERVKILRISAQLLKEIFMDPLCFLAVQH
jgi:hypothetical protein